MPLIRRQGNAVMQRVKHPPVRNKIDLTEPAQVRAWTRRLEISPDVLKALIDKVGNSVAAVTKEVELQRADLQTPPASAGSAGVEGKLPTQV
jgi:Protein of unknown function (DUF3606)